MAGRIRSEFNEVQRQTDELDKIYPIGLAVGSHQHYPIRLAFNSRMGKPEVVPVPMPRRCAANLPIPNTDAPIA